MTRRAAVWATGGWVGLTTPLWLRRRRLRLLLQPPDELAAEPAAEPAAEFSELDGGPAEQVRIAWLVLRVLSRLPFSPWRNTCLFRSIARCRCLRAHGVAACVRLGVRSDAGGEQPVAAHAWVEIAGPASSPGSAADSVEHPASYTLFRPGTAARG
jgi:hypothetical protein